MTKHKQLVIFTCSVVFICLGIFAAILWSIHSQKSDGIQSVVGETESKTQLEQEKTILELLSPENLEREQKSRKSSYKP